LKTTALSKDIFLIDQFWPIEKCDEFIAKSESKGYEAATVQTEAGPRVIDHVRNNNRILYNDIALAEELWNKLAPHAPMSIGDSESIGLNELFRFYRYQPGQQFIKHRDQSYIRNSREASYYTFMIYLNDNFNGGETRFKDLIIAPKKGAALIFYHYLEHEGAEVTEGIKYVLRTDIMFRLNVKGNDT
jgi:prolyl 4-hydroxylase